MDSKKRHLRVKKKLIIVMIISMFLFALTAQPVKGFEQKEDQIVQAQQTEGCEKVGHYVSPGFSEVVVKNDIAYIRSYYRGYYTVDVSDKANPTILSHQNLIGRNKFFYIENDYAYFALYPLSFGSDSSLLICDVSDPNNPINISETTIPGHKYLDVYVKDNYAYLGYDYGFYVMDISNPLTPILVNTTFLGGLVSDFYIRNDTLFVSDHYYGMSVFNISTPENPELICRYNGSDGLLIPHFAAPKFSLSGNYIYATTGLGLLIINATNPENLTYCNLVEDWGSMYTSPIDIEGDYIYLQGKILHKNNITHPTLISEHDYEGVGHDALGNYLYVTNGGLEIVDITNPASVTLEGEVGEGSYWMSAVTIDITGDYAYLGCGYAGLFVLDISDPSNPQKVAELYKETYGIKDVKIIGDYAYIGTSLHGLIILDTSNPAAPTEVDEIYSVEIAGETINLTWMYEIDVHDDYAYLAFDEYLVILDISNLEAPVAVGKYHNEFGVVRVHANGDRVYILGDDGLQILNVKDKSSPKKIGNYSSELLGGDGRDLDISGNYAFIGCFHKVEILNVRNAANVKNVSIVEHQGLTVCIAGRYLCVTSGPEFSMYDLNKIQEPTMFTTFWDSDYTLCRNPWDTSSNIYDVMIRDGYAYLAHGTNGLVIISLPVTLPGNIGIEFTYTAITFVTMITLLVFLTRKKRK